MAGGVKSFFRLMMVCGKGGLRLGGHRLRYAQGGHYMACQNLRVMDGQTNRCFLDGRYMVCLMMNRVTVCRQKTCQSCCDLRVGCMACLMKCVLGGHRTICRKHHAQDGHYMGALLMFLLTGDHRRAYLYCLHDLLHLHLACGLHVEHLCCFCCLILVRMIWNLKVCSSLFFRLWHFYLKILKACRRDYCLVF
jgi:hypothetical protein